MTRPKDGNIRWFTFNEIIDTSPAELVKKISANSDAGKIRFTPTDKLIFLTIFRGAKTRLYNGERGYYSTESVRQIAKSTGVKKDTVTASVKKWLAAGMLKVARKGTAPGIATVYKVKHFNVKQNTKSR